MKLTFPHMGNVYISVKALLDTIGTDYYMPPPWSRDNMQRGINSSPEFMCLPFKKILGDFIDGLEHGADTILFGESCGRCRMNYYGDLQTKILRDMGYRFDYIHLNLSSLTYGEIMSKLGPLFKGTGKALAVSAVTSAVRTIFAVDGLYRAACFVRCRESVKGSTDSIMLEFEEQAGRARGFAETRLALSEARVKLSRVATDARADPVKIGIVGEIFMLSDMFSNLEIEKKLGGMGAFAVNTMSVSEWMKKHFIRAMLPVKPRDKAVAAAQKYMRAKDIGGHGIYTVGNAELMCRSGFDGIIQVYPFTCMPEITAQPALGEISEKNGTPVMTLILDEMTSETGYVTRLEAFTDMLKMKKEKSSAS